MRASRCRCVGYTPLSKPTLVQQSLCDPNAVIALINTHVLNGQSFRRVSCEAGHEEACRIALRATSVKSSEPEAWQGSGAEDIDRVSTCKSDTCTTRRVLLPHVAWGVLEVS